MTWNTKTRCETGVKTKELTETERRIRKYYQHFHGDIFDDVDKLAKLSRSLIQNIRASIVAQRLSHHCSASILDGLCPDCSKRDARTRPDWPQPGWHQLVQNAASQGASSVFGNPRGPPLLLALCAHPFSAHTSTDGRNNLGSQQSFILHVEEVRLSFFNHDMILYKESSKESSKVYQKQ